MKRWERFLQKDNTIDVLTSECVFDYELYYGPVERPFAFFEIKNETKKISDILVQLELAPSQTWCRKNNWAWELEPGYQEVEFGSTRVKLCITIKPPPRVFWNETPAKFTDLTVEEIDEFARQSMHGNGD